MADSATLGEALARALSPDALTGDPAVCREHAVDGLAPAFVARPGDVAGVAAALRAANSLGAAVVPWGGGTQQALGFPPRRVDLVLSVARLNGVHRHDPAARTVACGAGCTGRQLFELLSAHDQILPLDPPAPQRATFGGIVATATTGPRSGFYGSIRDLLIGVAVVRADGTVVEGDDPPAAHLGALGTLGVIVGVELRVLPRPAALAGVAAGFPHLAGALAAAGRLVAAQPPPSAINLLGQLPDGSGGERGLRDVGLSAIVEGAEEAVRGGVERIAAWCRDNGGRANALERPAAIAALHPAIDFPQTAQLAPDVAVIRLGAPPGQLRDALDQVGELAVAHRLPGSWLARAADGTVFLRLGRVDRDGGAALRALQDDLAARWPDSVVLGCAPALKRGLAVWGARSPGPAAMRELKGRADPGDILNPGRFAGAT
jgi:glycolate oxidase FAD binding subunit